MLSLPEDDLRRLKFAMQNYARETGIAYRVETYADQGLMMVTDAGSGQGRCLFFAVREIKGHEDLIALTVYKKEGQKASRLALARAQRRMKEIE